METLRRAEERFVRRYTMVKKLRNKGYYATLFAGCLKALGIGAGIAVFGLLAEPTDAEVSMAASATARYEYDSNLFDLPNDYTALGLPRIRRDDWYQQYGAAFQLTDLWGLQKFFTTVAVKDFRYGYFTDLDHTEYSADAGLNWRLGPEFDGKLEVLRARSMVPFYDTQQIELSLQTEQRETAQANFQFARDWAVQGVGFYRTVGQSLTGEPDLQLAETSGQATLQYLGKAGLIAGIGATYVTGRYSGANLLGTEASGNLTGTYGGSTVPDSALIGDSSYHQITEELVATYQISGRSSLTGKAGYTRRTSPDSLNDGNGPTGELSFDSRLTGKTSLVLSLTRRINSYLTDSGADIETAAIVGVNWQITRKLGLSAGYAYTNRSLPDQGVAHDTERVDHFQEGTLTFDYQPFKWLWIESYANLQTRKSNFIDGDFNASVYGIRFNVQKRCLPPISFGPDTRGALPTCPAS